MKDLSELKAEWDENAQTNIDYEGNIQKAAPYIAALEVHVAVLREQVDRLAEKAWKYDSLNK